MTEPDTHALRTTARPEIPAPDLRWQPPKPRNYRPRIGLIGAGGIASAHLDAYRTAGWQVAAICNRSLGRATARAAEFAPDARVTDRYQDFLSDPEIDTARAPLMAQVLVRLDHGQAALVFDGATPHGPRDTTYVAGTHGSLNSEGPDLGQQQVTLTTAAGTARPALHGTWFNDGCCGAMGALLTAIEDDTEPANGAADNLHSLALAFAAIRASRTGREVEVGTVRALASLPT